VVGQEVGDLERANLGGTDIGTAMGFGGGLAEQVGGDFSSNNLGMGPNQ
jgi:hypothetical protein